MGTARQITCKQLLKELSDYLDGLLEPEARIQLEAHLAKCPDCWVVCDTTRKTIEVFKGLDPYPLPEDVKSRLVKALRRRANQAGHS